MAKKKPIKVLSKEELESKSTKELLGYLKRLNQCPESFELSDLDVNIDLTDSSFIYFKQTKKWKAAYDIVKVILKKREHIEK